MTQNAQDLIKQSQLLSHINNSSYKRTNQGHRSFFSMFQLTDKSSTTLFIAFQMAVCDSYTIG